MIVNIHFKKVRITQVLYKFYRAAELDKNTFRM